jgi:ESX secretion-associated protein EspB
MTQTLNVEYAELTTRADEVETRLAAVPHDNAQASCALEMILTAAEQLELSADNMRIYLGAGERERGRLAQSLRNAADAYRDADEKAADALDYETSISAATPKSLDHGVDPAMLTETASLMSRVPVPYSSAKEAAQKLMRGDQGASLIRFADDWTAYQRILLEACHRFRPFSEWDCDASRAAEQNFDQHRAWLNHMANLCGQLASQARNIVAAHRWAVREHPTLEHIRQLDERWVATQRLPGWDSPLGKGALLRIYAEFQAKSEAVLAEYERRAALPLAPISPPRPPNAYKYVPTPEFGPGPGPVPMPSPLPTPDGGLPPGGMPMPGMPFGGMPSMPTDSQLANSTLSQSAKDSQRSSTGAGLKPASVGGGGAGVPAMPLQRPLGSGATSGINAAPGAAGAGRAIPVPAAYAALNGGGGMGMPMGAPAGQSQAAGKGKRGPQEDQALYTENRAWTEGIIGRRRA